MQLDNYESSEISEKIKDNFFTSDPRELLALIAAAFERIAELENKLKQLSK